MNRADRRREAKNTRKYTYAELKKAIKETGLAVGRHNIGLTLSCVAIVLYRDHGFSTEQCADFLVEVGKESEKYLSYIEAQEASKELTGLDVVSMFEEHSFI